MIPSVPTRLGKYDLIARIAKGGMAEIYLARQHGMVGFSRLVVVKRILPHLAEEHQFVRMFFEEARVAALVSHPNVVQIFDVDQFEGNYYIAMEYINGPSISTVVQEARRRGTVLPFQMAAEIIQQACNGLHAAHELVDEAGTRLEIVHRDVSPHNLMITDTGLVKLVDFGIAKAQDSAVRTRTGNIKGKYPYMSPEQCRGEPLDRRTDIFSLGVVFFELVVGQRLFRRNTELMTLKAITEDPIPRVWEIQPEVPRAISDIIHRALERDRESRYATAAEMGAAVQDTLATLSVKTSQALLGKYLKTELKDLLARRSAAIQKVSESSQSGANIPIVDALESDEQPSGSSNLEEPLPDLPEVNSRHRLPLRKIVIVSLCVLLLALGSGLAFSLLRTPSRPPGPALLFGMAPSFPAEVAQAEMVPLLRFLEQKLGRRLELHVAKDYRTLREELVVGKLAFAHLPPLPYVLARHQNRLLTPLVIHIYEGTRTYQGLIVTREGGGIQEISQLRDKRFCYVDAESTSGYLLPRYHLRKMKIDPDKFFHATRFSGDHIKVMKDILAHKCEAGAVYSGAKNVASRHGIAAMQIQDLTTTGTLPHEVICASSKLPDKLVKRMRQALLEMDMERDLGRKRVGSNLPISGFQPIRQAEFDFVESVARSEGFIK